MGSRRDNRYVRTDRMHSVRTPTLLLSSLTLSGAFSFYILALVGALLFRNGDVAVGATYMFTAVAAAAVTVIGVITVWDMVTRRPSPTVEQRTARAVQAVNDRPAR